MVGLLLAFMERASSSPPTNGGSSGGSAPGSTIARSAAMHLAGAGRVNLVNFSTCLYGLARVMVSPVHPSN